MLLVCLFMIPLDLWNNKVVVNCISRQGNRGTEIESPSSRIIELICSSVVSWAQVLRSQGPTFPKGLRFLLCSCASVTFEKWKNDWMQNSQKRWRQYYPYYCLYPPEICITQEIIFLLSFHDCLGIPGSDGACPKVHKPHFLYLGNVLGFPI